VGIDSEQSGADLVLFKPVGLIALRPQLDELLAATAASPVSVPVLCDAESKELFKLDFAMLGCLIRS
jgi:hypothetical protein